MSDDGGWFVMGEEVLNVMTADEGRCISREGMTIGWRGDITVECVRLRLRGDECKNGQLNLAGMFLRLVVTCRVAFEQN